MLSPLFRVSFGIGRLLTHICLCAFVRNLFYIFDNTGAGFLLDLNSTPRDNARKNINKNTMILLLSTVLGLNSIFMKQKLLACASLQHRQINK